MALKIALKPNEKIVVNGAVIANGDKSARLHFLNNARFLREKDIMQEEDAVRDEDYLYFLVQLIYIDEEGADGYRLQLDYVVDKLKENNPDDVAKIDEIISLVDDGKTYDALKQCRKVYPPEKTAKQAASHGADRTSHHAGNYGDGK